MLIVLFTFCLKFVGKTLPCYSNSVHYFFIHSAWLCLCVCNIIRYMCYCCVAVHTHILVILIIHSSSVLPILSTFLTYTHYTHLINNGTFYFWFILPIFLFGICGQRQYFFNTPFILKWKVAQYRLPLPCHFHLTVCPGNHPMSVCRDCSQCSFQLDNITSHGWHTVPVCGHLHCCLHFKTWTV